MPTEKPSDRPSPPPLPATSAVISRGTSLLNVWTLIALAALLAAAMQWDYILSCRYDFLRIDCIAAGIAGGIGAAACLGGAMHFTALAPPGTWWLWKLLLLVQKRLLMIAQLLVMAVCVFAAGLIVFHMDIPGSQAALQNWRPKAGQAVLMY